MEILDEKLVKRDRFAYVSKPNRAIPWDSYVCIGYVHALALVSSFRLIA